MTLQELNADLQVHSQTFFYSFEEIRGPMSPGFGR